MPKPLLALACLAFLALSGCSGGDGGGGGGGAADGTSSSTLTSTGPPPKPVVTSDTLHLLAAPVMALALPDGGSEQRTGTAGNFGGGGGGGGGQEGPPARWMHQVNSNSSVTTAEVHVWIEITDTLVPFPPNPFQGQQCTWSVQLALGADAEPHTGCLNDPPGPISPGTRELVFDLVGLDADLEVNETITFTFRRAAFSGSAEDSVFVLSGTEKHDSRLVLAGLKEVVPEA